MATYNEAGWTYNQIGTTYNGFVLPASGLTLLVSGLDVTAELANRSLGIHINTHGNSLGTLDATFNDPATLPVTEQNVAAYTGAQQLFDGTIRNVEIDEHKVGTHKFAKINAQDAGPSGALPTAAPFGLSDTPNGTTTKGYSRLRKLTRTTEGGAAKTTYTATYREDGLWANMNVQLTSAILGLSALERTIVDATLEYPAAAAPMYTFVLGEPLVELTEIVAEIQEIEPGSITTTEIADNAISTPKLQANVVTAEELAAGAVTTEKLDANAVVANVLNVSGTVEIDSTGIDVTGGAMTVRNSGGTVIIDGESDMFRIIATGTLTTSSFANPGISTVSTDVSTGLGYVPLIYMSASFGGGTIGQPVLSLTTDAAGHWLDLFTGYAENIGGGVTRVYATVKSSRGTGTTAAYTFKYYLLEQVAI